MLHFHWEVLLHWRTKAHGHGRVHVECLEKRNKRGRCHCLNNYFTRHGPSARNHKTRRETQHTVEASKQTPVEWITHRSPVDTQRRHAAFTTRRRHNRRARIRVCVCVRVRGLLSPHASNWRCSRIHPMFMYNFDTHAEHAQAYLTHLSQRV